MNVWIVLCVCVCALLLILFSYSFFLPIHPCIFSVVVDYLSTLHHCSGFFSDIVCASSPISLMASMIEFLYYVFVVSIYKACIYWCLMVHGLATGTHHKLFLCTHPLWKYMKIKRCWFWTFVFCSSFLFTPCHDSCFMLIKKNLYYIM